MDSGSSSGSGVRPYKPEVFASYGNGWRQLWPHFLPLFVIGLIYLVIGFAISIPQFIGQVSLGSTSSSFGAFAVFWGFVSFAYGIFINGPLEFGQYFAYLKASRGDDVEVSDLFAAFKNYWNAVGASILVSIIVSVALFFLIVPGIYFGCKLAFVPFLVVDKKMGIGKAFGESWRMASHGRAWKVFLLGLLAIPIFIVGLIIIGVGVIISFMWVYTAFGSLYHAIDMGREQTPINELLPVNP